MLILTHASVAEILEAGGVRATAVDPSRAKACRYVVICHDAEGQEAHGHAFMVATIKDVVPYADANGEWLIILSKYVAGDFGSQWDGRNSVAYHSAAEYATGYDGVEFAALQLRAMPARQQAWATRL